MTRPEDFNITTLEVEPTYSVVKHYLEDRAIPVDDAAMEANGLEVAGAERIAEVLGYPLPGAVGVIIHYPNSDYKLVRLVGGPAKGPRCPKGVPVEAYLPASIDWATVSGTLVICESALKALTWARFGHNALSSGGVGAVWMNGKQQWCENFPHAAIEAGAISKVLIAFDSDIYDNHNVARDQRTLTRALTDRYPDLEVLIHHLEPPAEGEFSKDHWGCDDACHVRGDEWFAEWSNAAIGLVPDRDKLRDHLDALDSAYVYIERTMEVGVLADGWAITPTAFKGPQEGKRTFPTGEGTKTCNPAAIWLLAEKKNVIKDYIYTPGAGILDDQYFNQWRPSEVIPKAGDVSRYVDLINDAIECEDTRKLLWQCMAYQVQNRGKRLPKLIYISGTEVGTGKSTIVKVLGDILGESNAPNITRDDLESGYNECWAAKELVVLDDIVKLKADTWGMIKTHITSQRVTITQKHKPSRSQPNYAVFYITANVSDILTTDAEDRRVLMVDFRPSVVHINDGWWDDFYKWLGTGGTEAIAHYLGTMDLSDFDPNFYPPYSALKEAAVEATRDDDENWLIDYFKAPYDFVPEGREVILGPELWMLYSQSAPSPANAQERRTLGRIASTKHGMRRAVRQQVYFGKERCAVYFVPRKGGKFPKPTNSKDQIELYRKNIKDFPITLDAPSK